VLVFSLQSEQQFNPRRHVERVLGRVGDGDVTIACWEPGQISSYHCHPNATEIYFCFEGGGTMRTPEQHVEVTPGSFVVHPPGELHEFCAGPSRTLLFRVRYGAEQIETRTIAWRGNPDWQPRPEDLAYRQANPVAV
jgi:quercetin dioxygenase-like cupin family protein